MFSTEKTKMCSKLSAASWTLAKSFCDSSLPFLSVLVRCTTFWRFDLGIVAVLLWLCWESLRARKKFEVPENQRGIFGEPPKLGSRGSSSTMQVYLHLPHAPSPQYTMLRR
jgi:hypothetical protein